MKKFLLLLVAALLLPVAVNAQPIPKIMGHYENDSISTQGFSVGNSGTRSIAIILEPDELEMYQGGKITAVRVGLAQPTLISKIIIQPVIGTNKYGDRVEWDCEMNSAGWNTFELPTPYDINLGETEKLLIGFYYAQSAEISPLSFVNVGDIYDTYAYTKVGNKTIWKENKTTAYGNLSLQCRVEKDSYPDYLITAYDLRTKSMIQGGDDLPVVMTVRNRGIKQIEAGGLTMEALIDDELVTTFSNETPFEKGFCTVSAGIPTDGISSGNHSLTINLVAVDGVELETPISLQTTFSSYKQGFPRQKHLVEQFTSTYCTYCPLGNSMLSILTSLRDDIIWVGIHGNLGSGVDPYHSNQADSIMAFQGCTGYPSGSFDRSTGWDDDVNIANGLGYNTSYHQLVAQYLSQFFDYIEETNPSFIEVNGDCSFNESTRTATVSIHGRIAPDFDPVVGDDCRLTVYLTEDGLVSPQLNSGTWVTNYVHNGVFRKALSTVKGVQLNRQNANYYKNVFRFNIPNGWDWTKMNVVAFVSRPITNYVNGYTDMYVNNANSFKFVISDGVEEIVTDPDAVPVAFFDMMGRQHDTLQQGINIVMMSDGTSRKVLVK